MRPLSRFSAYRTMLVVAIAACIVGAVVVAILLGVLDRPAGWRSGPG
jgi:hypothetical protein